MDTMARLSGVNRVKDLHFISHQKYLRVPKPHEDKPYTRNKIAIIYAEGDIVSGDPGEGSIGSEAISKAIRGAREDSTIKAIVFRVNSGGGSALASEVIWRELYLAHKVKPVIASMGDVAASGGYYIVTAADTIVASPNTITGSIGVFGLLVDASGFFNDKLGLTTDVEKTNLNGERYSRGGWRTRCCRKRSPLSDRSRCCAGRTAGRGLSRASPRQGGCVHLTSGVVSLDGSLMGKIGTTATAR